VRADGSHRESGETANPNIPTLGIPPPSGGGGCQCGRAGGTWQGLTSPSAGTPWIRTGRHPPGIDWCSWSRFARGLCVTKRRWSYGHGSQTLIYTKCRRKPAVQPWVAQLSHSSMTGTELGKLSIIRC